MKIRIQEGLPFISATIDYIGRSTTLDNILLDTGSTGSQTPVWEPMPYKLWLAMLREAGASNAWFPSWSSRCYTQIQEGRHSGMDCRNPVTGM